MSRRLLLRWWLAPLALAVAAVLLGGPGPASAGERGTSTEAGDAEAEELDVLEERERDELVDEGRQLYEVGCSSCHGLQGAGAPGPGGEPRGPSLLESGEAGAFYYLSTGRMPMANSEQSPVAKQPLYDPEQIEALVAYVGSLGDGPDIPEVDLDDAELAEGGELFRANCAACHSAAAAGGALSYGRAAPALDQVGPLQIAAAVRVGPGQMPVFSEATLSDEELADVISYVEYLESPEDPGGLPLGRIGPIPEGFVAWAIGIPVLLLFTYWIGNRADEHAPEEMP